MNGDNDGIKKNNYTMIRPQLNLLLPLASGLYLSCPLSRTVLIFRYLTFLKLSDYINQDRHIILIPFSSSALKYAQNF
jgi:hypothetical protein